MKWEVRIADEAKKEYKKLEGSVRKQVLAGISKVSKAPIPSPDGYGKPLGNKGGNNLTGFLRSSIGELVSALYIRWPWIRIS